VTEPKIFEGLNDGQTFSLKTNNIISKSQATGLELILEWHVLTTSKQTRLRTSPLTLSTVARTISRVTFTLTARCVFCNRFVLICNGGGILSKAVVAKALARQLQSFSSNSRQRKEFVRERRAQKTLTGV